MKLFGKFILGAGLLLTMFMVMGVGVMFIQLLTQEQGELSTYQYCFITIAVCFSATSLFVHFLSLIGYTKE